MTLQRSGALLFATVLLACASEQPASIAFDSSKGLVVIDILGDGFVLCGERRLPVEALVLELRQRTRAMSTDDLQKFVVHLRAIEMEPGSESARQAKRAADRLVDELHIMGVRQVVYL